MKKILTFFFAAAAVVTALAGCARENESAPANGKQQIKFFAESIATRTTFAAPEGNSYPVLWTEQDQNVKVILNMTESNDAAVTPSADFKTATFAATFADAESYSFCSVSPAKAWTSSAVENERVGLKVPTTQTPSAVSVDPAAQILVAKAATSATRPETVNFAFTHWTAYGKVALANLALDGDTIASVTLEAEADVNWAGDWTYDFAGGASAAAGTGSSGTIVVKTASATDIWFGCAPVDMSGKKLKVTVKTDKGNYVKEITLPADRKFISGQIARFSVDMTGAEFSKDYIYREVASASELTEGSKIIIGLIYGGKSNAISTTFTAGKTYQNITMDLTIANGEIKNPGADVEVYTLEVPAEGKYAFKASNGEYLFTKSSADGLWKGEKPEGDDVNGEQFTVSFLEDRTEIRSVIKSDDTQRGIIKRYSAGSTPVMNVYASNKPGTDAKYNPKLYKLAE